MSDLNTSMVRVMFLYRAELSGIKQKISMA